MFVLQNYKYSNWDKESDYDCYYELGIQSFPKSLFFISEASLISCEFGFLLYSALVEEKRKGKKIQRHEAAIENLLGATPFSDAVAN